MRARTMRLAAAGAVLAALAFPGAPAMARTHPSAVARTLKQVAAMQTETASLHAELGALQSKAAELEARQPPAPPPSGPAGGELAGSYPNPTVKAGAVSSEDLLDGTLQAEDFVPGSLVPANFAPGALGSIAIADGQIGLTHLIGGSVGGPQLAAVHIVRTPRVAVAQGKKGVAAAECPAGETLIGGGVEWQSVPVGAFEPGVNFPGLTTTNSEPSPLHNVWIVDGINVSEVAASLNAYALCLK